MKTMIIDPEVQSCNRIVMRAETTEKGLTIRQLLRNQWQISGRMLTRLKKEAGVRLNGSWAPFSRRVTAGDCLELVMEEDACEFYVQKLPFQVLYEDVDILVVNKPPGMLTHPTTTIREGTLANGVMHHMQEHHETYKVRFVNRLDMDTSGVMVLAKNAFSHHALMTQMEKDMMVKTYRVFVWGSVTPKCGIIDAPIYRREDLALNEPPLRIVDPRGKAAVSRYEVEALYPEATLVKITLETGRTHQIRVHMKHLGHPVIGDDFYEPNQPRIIGRQALHASETSFIQPRFGNRISIAAGFPDDLLQLEQFLTKRQPEPRHEKRTGQ